MARTQRLIVVAVALLVGPSLIATSLLLVAHPWATKASYALPGFPEPRIPLGDDERERLAAVGTRAIQPWRADGIDEMRAAERDSGARAFEPQELAHFEDVRGVMLLFLVTGAVGVAGIVISLASGRARPLARRGLTVGTRLTVAVFAVLGLLMLAGFDRFFDGFHAVFFEGDSWKLPTLGTARSLYPDALWGLLGGVVVALVLAQAAAIELVIRRGARRGGSSHPQTPRAPI